MILGKKVSTGILAIVLLALNTGFMSAKASSLDHSTQKRMVIFGDSYSDNGNDYRLTAGRYPNAVAYYQGRFSNGPVWVEYLAQRLGINPSNPQQFINFAYGQSKILSATSITVYCATNQQYVVPGLSDEISAYEAQYKKFKPSDLVVVFISTNDFFDLSDVNDRNFFLKAADYQVVQIHRLIQLGAKHLVVLNGRDVTLSPLARIIASTNTGSMDNVKITNYLHYFRSLIKLYNNRLGDALRHAKEVVLYDTFHFDNKTFNKIQNNQMCYQNQQGDYQNVA